MTAGIRAYNDGGNALLSEDTGPFNLWQRISTASTVAGGYNPDATLQCANVSTYASNAPSYPLVFVKLASTYSVVLRIYGSAGAWNIEVLHFGTAPMIYVFCKPNPYTGSETYGMKIFNSTGGTVFDSRLGNRLNVRAVVTSNFGNLANTTLPQTYAGGQIANTVTLRSYRGVYYYTGYYTNSSVKYSLNINAESSVSATSLDLVSLPSYAISERHYYWNTVKVQYNAYYDEGSDSIYTAPPTYTYDNNTEWAIYRGGAAFIGGYFRIGWVPHVTGHYYSRTINAPDVYYAPGGGYGGGGSTITFPSTGGTVPYANQAYNLSPGLIYLASSADYN